MHDMAGVRDLRTAVCGANLASRQVLFGFLALTGSVLIFFSFACKRGDFTEMPRFQLSNEKKSDLVLWGPYSHVASSAFSLGRTCDLPFARAPPLSINPQLRGGCQEPLLPSRSPMACFVVFLTPDSFLSCLPYRRWACGLSVGTGRGYCWTLSRSEHSLRAVNCMNMAHLKFNKTKPHFFIMENVKCTQK